MPNFRTASDFVSRLKAREAGAQLELREELLPAMTATCSRLLKDAQRGREVAEDLLVDFLFGQIDNLREPSMLEAYVRMMAVRRCVRLLQGDRQRLATQSDPPLTEEPSELAAALLGHAESAWARERLLSCLSRVERRNASVLRMRFGYDLSFSEIGVALRISKQHASHIVDKSLDFLRRCLSRRRS